MSPSLSVSALAGLPDDIKRQLQEFKKIKDDEKKRKDAVQTKKKKRDAERKDAEIAIREAEWAHSAAMEKKIADTLARRRSLKMAQPMHSTRRIVTAAREPPEFPPTPTSLAAETETKVTAEEAALVERSVAAEAEEASVA